MAINQRNTPLYTGRIITSVWGGRLGLDEDNILVGPPDIKKEVRTISTTVPTTIAAHGMVRIMTTGSTQGPTQHELDAPIPGVDLTLMLNTTSTGSCQFGTTVAGASVFISSLGSTGEWINLLGPGGSVTLTGITTAIWGVKSVAHVAAVSFSTST